MISLDSKNTNKLESPRLEEFTLYLRQKGLKLTKQRELIARKIFQASEHFTIDQLTTYFHNSKKKISRATIYRIISIMTGSGLLLEHDFGKNVKFYEHASHKNSHHDHTICINCGHIVEFYNNEIEKIQIKIANKLGYDLEHHSLNLYGNCRKLQKKGFCEHQEKTKQL